MIFNVVIFTIIFYFIGKAHGRKLNNTCLLHSSITLLRNAVLTMALNPNCPHAIIYQVGEELNRIDIGFRELLDNGTQPDNPGSLIPEYALEHIYKYANPKLVETIQWAADLSTKEDKLEGDDVD